jgi:hypothetical protein
MAEKILAEGNSAKQSREANAKNDILRGIFLFVGMNLLFVLGRNVLSNIAGRIDTVFFGNSDVHVRIFIAIYLVCTIFTNFAVLIYLLVKRPIMIVGMLSGIPALFLVLILLSLAVCVFVFVAWFALLFIHGIGLI